MTSNGIYQISAAQTVSTNQTEVSHDPTSKQHSPPPLSRHPTLPPMRLNAILSAPGNQTQQSPDAVSLASDGMPTETAAIFDYMIWSQINLVLGAIILGIPCFLLSRQTRKYKRESIVKKAKILSIITLLLNILVSFIFTCSMIYLVTRHSGFQ